MPQQPRNLEDALQHHDWAAHRADLESAEHERQQMLARFPLEGWPDMPLERYAVGHERSEDAYGRWIEFVANHMGSMRGGSARKHIVYKHKNKPGWYYYPADKYPDVDAAWQAVRAGFVEAFEKAKAGRWEEIDGIEALQGGPVMRLKSLYLYFPADVLPIYSRDHLRHFLSLLAKPEGSEHTYDVVRLNRVLLAALRERPELKSRTTKELERFLYSWADPRESRRVVKIAPGEGARLWRDCLDGGYICVGWDEIGSLEQFDTEEELQADFSRAFAALHKNHQPTLRRKAKELWTLRELEPGDIVIANKGTSHVLAVGEVVEPGYEFLEHRSEYKHVVHVKWNTDHAQDIPTQNRWGLVTVAPVAAALYQQILAGKVEGEAPAPVPVDRIFTELADALDRKGQAILYGPPGTGKTYTARRFAVWWLRRHDGERDPAEPLVSKEAFARAEQELSTVQVIRKVWWMVANPKEWSWDRLFAEGRVAYRYGRLARNYPRVQRGDLVVGYQSTPDKKIMALAKVTQGLHTTHAGEQRIELEPLARLGDGLTYDELAADKILASAEPMRFRNQGTLFALSDEEAEHLLSILAERDPQVREHADERSAVGPLTRLTFHASYSYEDFIEGFRPVDAGGGALSLRLEDGVFKRICREAQANPKRRYVVLIDEINRANVAKVFGELVTLLEIDKRGLAITLPQSKESFTIPANVYVLGTMNTADRSIKLLDAALRRRFAFIEMMPDSSQLAGARVGNLALDDFLDELNRRVAKREGREKQIGHSFLLEGEQPVSDAQELSRRFRHEVLPLLQEYCYDDYAALATYLGARVVDAEAQTLKQSVLDDPDALVAALEAEFGRDRPEGD